MSALRAKSLTELRGIAQSFGVQDIFKKDPSQLIQAIEMKQQAIAIPQKIEIPKPTYDARLMLKPPSKQSSKQEIEQLLVPYVERGLNISFDEERWYMRHGIRTDEGTLRMPLRTVIRCADKIME